MPAPTASILHGPTVVVRFTSRSVLWVNDRRLCRHGQHGALYELPAGDALRLAELGAATLPAGIRRQALRDHVARLA